MDHQKLIGPFIVKIIFYTIISAVLVAIYNSQIVATILPASITMGVFTALNLHGRADTEQYLFDLIATAFCWAVVYLHFNV